MTIDIDAIRQREQAATDGPWWAWNRGVGYVIAIGTPGDVDQDDRPSRELPEGLRTDIGRREDAEFIAHARQDIPALIGRVTELDADLNRLTGEYAEALTTITNAWAALNRANVQSPTHTVAELIDRLAGERDAFRAQVADLADKLHKANADNASLTKAATAWANEMAAKDDLTERLAGVVADMLSRFRGDGPNSRHSGWVRDETVAAWRAVYAEWASQYEPATTEAEVA